MTEETNETNGQAMGASEPDTVLDAVVPEDPAQAMDLPAASPPPPMGTPLSQASAPPPQASTPPMGLPQEPPASTPPAGLPQQPPAQVPPTGTYAMGALAANPAVSEAPSAPYGAAPGYGTAPAFGVAPGDTGGWPAPPAPPAPPAASGSHKVRNGLLVGGAALAVLAAGIGIGHGAWNNGTSNLSASNVAGSGQLTPRSGSGSSGSGSSGFPFGGRGFSGNSGSSGSSGNSGSGSGSSNSSNSSGPNDVSAIASKVDPGLVDINTTLGYQDDEAAGTGIVLTSNGVILTNNHVIDGATSVSVTDVGNGKTYTASVVGYDRTKDIAVLQLNNASGLTTASLATSANVSVGEQVVGIGNAGGTGGTPSAAGGTVTALNQSITASDEGDGTSEQLSGLIESNADIQPGDSGGPLVNTSGEVLGMDTAASAGFSFQSNDQSSGTQGFSIPITTALSIAREIEAGDASTTVHIGETAFLGVEISTGSSSTGGGGGSGGFFGGNSGSTGNTGTGNTGSSSASGADVAGVVTNGPAQEAGLAQGDVITSLGGKTITSADDLTNAMSIYHPGDKVQVAWTDSSGGTHTATVQLSSGPPQ